MRSILFLLLSVLVWANDTFKELDGEYDYVQAQNACKTLGEQWRLPAIWELFPLRGEVQRFGLDKNFWSSTELKTKKRVSHQAFVFYLQDGDIHPFPKILKHKLICTNTQPILQTEQFFTKTPKSVRDTLNDILWEPINEENSKVKKSFVQAKDYCAQKDLYGRSWRLPTLEELYSIINYNYTKPAINKAIFSKMKKRPYWTQKEFQKNQAFIVDFNVGSVNSIDQSEKKHIRCVSDAKQP